jgi:hypothetical protein
MDFALDLCTVRRQWKTATKHNDEHNRCAYQIIRPVLPSTLTVTAKVVPAVVVCIDIKVNG